MYLMYVILLSIVSGTCAFCLLKSYQRILYLELRIKRMADHKNYWCTQYMDLYNSKFLSAKGPTITKDGKVIYVNFK